MSRPFCWHLEIEVVAQARDFTDIHRCKGCGLYFEENEYDRGPLLAEAEVQPNTVGRR